MVRQERPAISQIPKRYHRWSGTVNIFAELARRALILLLALPSGVVPLFNRALLSLLPFFAPDFFSRDFVCPPPFSSSRSLATCNFDNPNKMRFTALSALWLAATAWAAVERSDDGSVRSIQVRHAPQS